MNTDEPLTREDLERFLQEAGSSTKLVLNGCNLGGIDLSGLDLSAASLYGANLSEANLSGANLVEAYLVRANLRNANLNGANLVGAYLGKADLTRADLTGADRSGVNLSQSSLNKIDLREVKPGTFVANLFRGRINRRSLLVGNLACEGIFFASIFIFGDIFSLTPIIDPVVIVVDVVTLLVWVLLLFVIVLFWISLTIRRFHDLDKDGSYILWTFVPFVNVYFGLLLLFQEGTVGPNRYGPPPRPSVQFFSYPTQEREHYTPPHA